MFKVGDIVVCLGSRMGRYKGKLFKITRIYTENDGTEFVDATLLDGTDDIIGFFARRFRKLTKLDKALT